MCGIVGYVGPREATDFLVSGLRRLEYRGYDSSGVATLTGSGSISVTKSTGRIDQLVELLGEQPALGTLGIGHTRWATHGPATNENAHPHIGGDGIVAVVHNGVVENYRPLKDRLIEKGYQFKSATDTEVVAHLIAESYAQVKEDGGKNGAAPGDDYEALIVAVRAAVAQLKGTYGLVVVFRDFPEVMIAAKVGSPLVVGVGEGEHFVASDAATLIGHTEQIVYLDDHELAVITADSLKVDHRDTGRIKHRVHALEMQSTEVDLGGYEHYMLKEIYEQPESIENAMRGRLNEDNATAVFGGLNLTPQQLRRVRRIVMTACGTSWHSGLVGEYMIEEIARIPVEIEYVSELRYRNPPMDDETLLFAITQSGETADTLAALREMKRKGHPSMAICNVVGSSIANEADGGIYLHAGPEIGVASTKAYTSQCTVMALLALYFGRLNHLGYDAGRRIIDELHELPDKVRQALDTNNRVREVAEKYAGCDNFLYLGRQFNFPTALEGALKLKEISYIHAEGYPAAEMKHGPIALVDEHTPSVFVMPHGSVYDKVMANVEEIKARGGPVIAIVGEGNTEVAKLADDVITVPHVETFLQPIVTVIPLHLLSYHIALIRGCDVDRPRNLAKSVTVE